MSMDDQSTIDKIIEMFKAIFVNAPSGIASFIGLLYFLQWLGIISEDIFKIFILLLIILAFIAIVISFITKEITAVKNTISSATKVLEESKVELSAAEEIVNGETGTTA